jgi:hypothetical protein
MVGWETVGYYNVTPASLGAQIGAKSEGHHPCLHEAKGFEEISCQQKLAGGC